MGVFKSLSRHRDFQEAASKTRNQCIREYAEIKGADDMIKKGGKAADLNEE